jgi:hypothetical protein
MPPSRILASMHVLHVRPSPVRRALLSLALCASLGVAACGDDKVVAIGGGPNDTSGDTAGQDVEGPDVPPARLRELIVLHDTATPLALRVTETRQIRVKLVDYGASGPAVDARMDFAIVNSTEGGTGSLNSQQVYTDTSGIATVTFRSGTAADKNYTIEVRANDAESVRFEIFVSDAPRGSVRVRLQYEGAVSLKNIHVRLVPGIYTCGQFNAVSPPTDLVAEKTVLGLGGGEVVWHNLPDAQRFTVFATATSQQDRLAAGGCLDGVVVLANQENTVTLNLYLLNLNAAGVYDAITTFDFTGAIPGTVGDVIDELSLLFNSPGTFLINQVKRLAAMYVGEFITNTIFGLFEDAVAREIDEWMFERSPSWLRSILTVGQDIMQIVNRLEMLSNLQITKLGGDFSIQGAQRWHGLALYWRYNCAREGQPGYDPNCGRNVFSMTDISNTEFPLNLVEGRFTASIQDFDRLSIDNHSIKLNYGRLVIFVLNELILETLTGHDNLLDAVRSFIDCAQLADRIYFGSLSTIGISESDIESFCDGAINIIITPLTLVLDALAMDTSIRLNGTAVLEDTNNDLRVDLIKDGAYMGHFESDGRAGEPFTGTWSASRASGF